MYELKYQDLYIVCEEDLTESFNSLITMIKLLDLDHYVIENYFNYNFHVEKIDRYYSLRFFIGSENKLYVLEVMNCGSVVYKCEDNYVKAIECFIELI